MSRKDIIEINYSGIGLFSACGLMFIGLKLAEIIDWHWIWVLAPFWIIPGIFLGLICIALAAVLIVLVAYGAISLILFIWMMGVELKDGKEKRRRNKEQ